MVKSEVNTPNKRKSLQANSSAKKTKVENGNGVASPTKLVSIKKEPHSPKGVQSPKIKVEPRNSLPKAGQSPKAFQSPKAVQSPKIKVEGRNSLPKAVQSPKAPKPVTPSPQANKKNKKGKAGGDSPKKVTSFAGTKQLTKSIEKVKKPKATLEAGEGKKKRKNAFANLIAQVKAKEGTNDPELLKILDIRLNAITERGDLTKTAKRKLSILNKLKLICTEGSTAASQKAKAQIAEKKKLGSEKKLQKKPVAAKKAAVGKKASKSPAPELADSEDDEEEEDDDDDSEVSDHDSDAEEDGDSAEEEEDTDAEDDDDDEDDEEDDDGEEAEEEEDDEDDSDEEEIPVPAPKEKVQPVLPKPTPKQPTITDLYSKDIVKKGQKRFVLFVGNIPYDATKEELATHFAKVGDIVDIRIPTEKGSNRPRGFAYVEVNNDTSYEKCMSMHHSQLRGRRINVLYTQGGKKKGDEKKKEIKGKNFKLHALRRQGKLAGSVKESQKRSFRRNKNKRENGQD
ncbi:hypothetical protein HUJ04_004429 [Dendroctonus ponderosae]|uniref:RRM domain-containing protein n=1 Tax=Dendroctonus ponderosae TaxID=77166 RepID=A0AAR5PA88_DENPD|nr:hypothetical protein HUJ04_004429 [Dendroctonus ponderosae]